MQDHHRLVGCSFIKLHQSALFARDFTMYCSHGMQPSSESVSQHQRDHLFLRLQRLCSISRTTNVGQLNSLLLKTCMTASAAFL